MADFKVLKPYPRSSITSLCFQFNNLLVFTKLCLGQKEAELVEGRRRATVIVTSGALTFILLASSLGSRVQLLVLDGCWTFLN